MDSWYFRNKYFSWWWYRLFLIRVTQQIFKQTKIEQIIVRLISVFSTSYIFVFVCFEQKMYKTYQTNKLRVIPIQNNLCPFFFEWNVFTYSKIVLDRSIFFLVKTKTFRFKSETFWTRSKTTFQYRMSLFDPCPKSFG